MPHLGKPLIVRCGDYFHLAHRTKGGVQLSIENWTTLWRARMAFGSADIEVWPGVTLSPGQVRQLNRVVTGEPLMHRRHLIALQRLGLITGVRRRDSKAVEATGLGRAIAEWIANELAREVPATAH